MVDRCAQVSKEGRGIVQEGFQESGTPTIFFSCSLCSVFHFCKTANSHKIMIPQLLLPGGNSLKEDNYTPGGDHRHSTVVLLGLYQTLHCQHTSWRGCYPCSLSYLNHSGQEVKSNLVDLCTVPAALFPSLHMQELFQRTPGNDLYDFEGDDKTKNGKKNCSGFSVG